MSRMKFKRFLICAILGNLSLFSLANYQDNFQNLNNIAYINRNANTTSNVEMQKVSIKQNLIDEVYSYINKKAPSSDKTLAKHIVDKALANQIDICFMMGQTEVETAYGTTGIGRSTSRHSLFGVYRTYESYAKCIDGYISILKNSYLVNGKTEQDLMKHYVNKNGSRYAGNPKYEVELSRTYRNIVASTNIKTLQIQYMKI